MAPGLSGKQTKPVTKQTFGASVKEIMDQLADAEECGEETRALSLLSQLNDRRRIPAKCFDFTDDVRPGYVGKILNAWWYISLLIEIPFRYLDKTIFKSETAHALCERHGSFEL